MWTCGYCQCYQLVIPVQTPLCLIYSVCFGNAALGSGAAHVGWAETMGRVPSHWRCAASLKALWLLLLQADKRAHHNALERKRRDHIKDSFHSLRDSVPALQGEKVSMAPGAHWKPGWVWLFLFVLLIREDEQARTDTVRIVGPTPGSDYEEI